MVSGLPTPRLRRRGCLRDGGLRLWHAQVEARGSHHQVQQPGLEGGHAPAGHAPRAKPAVQAALPQVVGVVENSIDIK